MVLVCGAQCTSKMNEKNQSYDLTRYTEVDAVSTYPGLICLVCNKCVAVKINGKYQSVTELLTTNEPVKNGWILSTNTWTHSLLNDVSYRINDPPNANNYECRYSPPDMKTDLLYILYDEKVAQGFATIRPKDPLCLVRRMWRIKFMILLFWIRSL